MHAPRLRPILALVASFALAAGTFVASAAVGDTSADRVVGQPTATSNAPDATGINASGLEAPFGAVFDAAGNLFVSDAENSRVLGYRSPMTSDRIADIVIGQPDFNSDTENNGGVSATSLAYPYGLAVSAAGDLYVADYINNRVLMYARPLATDRVADMVFGQPDFTTNTPNYPALGAASLSNPGGVALDAAGNLWIADTGNNRVLGYDNPAQTLDRIADRVLGQPSFDTNEPNEPDEPIAKSLDATTLYIPYSVAVDAQQNVWVADFVNARVLEYDNPIAFDETADFVLGQPDFTSGLPNYEGQVSAAGLNGPAGVSVDTNGNVYVGDAYNNRVLMYTSPLTLRDRIADRVIGQPDFTSSMENNGGVSEKSLFIPVTIAIDPTGNLAVTDYENNRVLLMQAPTPIVTSIAVKRSPATKTPKLLVEGYGMLASRAVVEVNGIPLTTKYKLVAADGSARRLVATDPDFGTLVPRGIEVQVTVYNPMTGGRSAPIPFTR
jgi:sugar lactone lactonase YvrE